MAILKERFGFDSLAARRSTLAFAGLPPGVRVLDIGTGSGWMALVLAEAGHSVTSIDVDAAATVGARKRAQEAGAGVAGRIRFLTAGGTRLPFSDGFFDAVFSFETMHHLPDCAAAVREMVRVCAPGGQIIVADLNTRGLRAVRAVVLETQGKRHQENVCSPAEVERLLLCIGSVERHDQRHITTFVVRPAGSSPGVSSPRAPYSSDHHGLS